MNNVQKNILYFALIVSLILLISCASEDIYIDDIEDNTLLTIYLIEDSDMGIKNAIQRYNTSIANDKREVEITFFKYDEKEEMYTQLLSEIALGGGPDIIVINKWTDTYIDIAKMAQNNTFEDIDMLIEKSETFDFNDYNKKVLNAGILNGKRVFMPISYKVEYMVGIEETFDYYDIESPNGMDIDTYITILTEYYNRTNNPALFWYDSVYLLEKFIEVGEPIDKSEKLETLFNLLKIENERSYDFRELNNIGDVKLNTYLEFINEDYLFFTPINYGTNQYERLHENYNYINIINESNMIWFPEPYIVEQGVKAYTEAGLAININSKNKNDAFKFIEYILSYSAQANSAEIHNLPVNIKTYNNEVRSFIEEINYKQYSNEINSVEPPLDMKKNFMEYVESVQSCEYIGSFRYIYLNIMQQSIEDYYDDKITFDEMIDEINNKLAIYYTE